MQLEGQKTFTIVYRQVRTQACVERTGNGVLVVSTVCPTALVSKNRNGEETHILICLKVEFQQDISSNTLLCYETRSYQCATQCLLHLCQFYCRAGQHDQNLIPWYQQLTVVFIHAWVGVSHILNWSQQTSFQAFTDLYCGPPFKLIMLDVIYRIFHNSSLLSGSAPMHTHTHRTR